MSQVILYSHPHSRGIRVQKLLEVFQIPHDLKTVEKIRELLSAMAGRFVGPYVLGEEFTMLDVILNVELSWYRITGIYPDGLEPYESFLNRTNHRMNWPEPE